jgi:hypothetical protein
VYEIETDVRSNRLYLDLSGRLNAETLDTAAEETTEGTEMLRDGFDIITDLRGFKPVSPDAAEAIQRAQTELVEMGVDQVVRITDEDTSQVVVSAFERRSKKAGYSGETAETREEAERLLDGARAAGSLA